MKLESIARITHEANRMFCEETGDLSQVPWDAAPDWQRQSALNGVQRILDGAITSPEQSHRSWWAEKADTGWRYGPVKDPEAKTHPCMVPFHQLPAVQQVKDHLFFNIVRALAV